MAKRRQYVVSRVLEQSHREDFPAAQEAAFAACPEAARFTDDESVEFWAAACYLDASTHQQIVARFQEARISYPPDIAFDEYRLSRHLFRRWSDPSVRLSFIDRCLRYQIGILPLLRRTRDTSLLGLNVERWGGPVVLDVLRRVGLPDLIQPLLDSFSPEEMARHQALLLHGKVMLHHLMTDPEPPRTSSVWEQRKLERRIRLREVQLRSMRRSLRRLHKERKGLLERLMRLQEQRRTHQPALDALAEELAQIRNQQSDAERRHAAAIAEQAARFREDIADLKSQLAAAEQDYRQASAVRRSWLQERKG